MSGEVMPSLRVLMERNIAHFEARFLAGWGLLLKRAAASVNAGEMTPSRVRRGLRQGVVKKSEERGITPPLRIWLPEGKARR